MVYRFSMNRVLAVALVTFFATLPAPGAAQPRDKAAAYDFLLFLQSVAAQRTARMCERGLPGYRQKFDDLYGQWSARHRAGIERGESTFRKALAEKDQPYTDRAKLEQLEKAVAELAQSPQETGPLTLDDRTKSLCDEILAELDAGLRP